MISIAEAAGPVIVRCPGCGNWDIDCPEVTSAPFTNDSEFLTILFACRSCDNQFRLKLSREEGPVRDGRRIWWLVWRQAS